MTSYSVYQLVAGFIFLALGLAMLALANTPALLIAGSLMLLIGLLRFALAWIEHKETRIS